MCKPILSTIFAFFVVLAISGCVGYVSLSPAECEIEAPTTDVVYPKNWQDTPLMTFVATKADFLKSWGKPDMINVTSVNSETWIYKRNNLWCGAVPALFLAIPLLLPVCDGFERIEFQGNNAKRVHIRRIVKHGFMMYPGAPEKFNDIACQLPRPVYRTAESDVKEPDAHAPP